MSGVDEIILELPAEFASLGDDDGGRRRWMAPDGTYVMAQAVLPPEEAEGCAEAADLVMATNLGTLSVERGADVAIMGAVPIVGANEARAARVKFQTVTGELVDAVVVVMARAGEVVLVHIIWPADDSEDRASMAVGICESLRFGS